MRLIAIGLLCLVLGVAICLMGAHPDAYAVQDREAISIAPSAQHSTGTDELGRDRTARIAMATLLSIGGALVASAWSTAVALLLGAIAALSPLWMRRVLLYCADLFVTLPWLFLLMSVRAAMPLNLSPWQSAALTFGLLGFLGGPIFLRTNFSRISALLRSDWLSYAHASGTKPTDLGRHLLPHLRPLLLTQLLVYVPVCVVAEANLGSMGLGLTEPLPSFGTFLAGLQAEILLSSSRMVFFPFIVLVVALVLLELAAFGVEAT